MEDVLGPFQLRHGTRIRITHLHKNVLASLRNRDVLMQIRAEVRAEGQEAVIGTFCTCHMRCVQS